MEYKDIELEQEFYFADDIEHRLFRKVTNLLYVNPSFTICASYHNAFCRRYTRQVESIHELVIPCR